MVRKVTKTLIAILSGAIGYGLYLLIANISKMVGILDISMLPKLWQVLIPIISIVIFGLLFYAIILTIFNSRRSQKGWLDVDIKHVPTNVIIVGTLGLVIGLLIAFFISRIFALINIPVLPIILSVACYIVFGYEGAYLGAKRADDVINILSGKSRIQSNVFKKKSDACPKIVDTSVIIDGRIAEILKTGFIEGDIIIPEFVLLELQHIADSSDSLKRNRGRRGLDILNHIQKEFGIEIYDTKGKKGIEEIPEVDIKLLKLAQMINGKVLTNDYNLNKVAKLKNVPVLNINELANTTKSVVLPGEPMRVFLVKEGKEKKQAVAYLDDGTMIVVEDGFKYIGQTVSVGVTSVLQTAAGRMIFARMDKAEGSSNVRK